MPAKCAANLLTFGPVVAVFFECREHPDGWSVLVQHRHWATTMFECESEHFEGLTLGELADVLEATLWQHSEGNADTR